MNDLEFTAESFDSSVVKNKLVVWLKTMAMDILTDLETSRSFQNLLDAASEASNLDGYIQIKDSLWASHTDITSLSQMISDDDEPYAAGGRSLRLPP